MIPLLTFNFPQNYLVATTHQHPKDGTVLWQGAVTEYRQWPGGSMLQQSLHHNGFTFCRLHFIIEQPLAISVTAGANAVFLQFTLAGNAMSLLSGYGLFPLVEGSYTPLYIPAGEHQYWMLPGNYSYVYMPVSQIALQHFSATHRHLQPLIQNWLQQANGGLMSERLRITPGMQQLIQNIQHLPRERSSGYLHLQNIFNGLLGLYNDQILHKTQAGYINTPEDYLAEIKMFVADNILNPQQIKVENLSTIFGIERRSIERYFSQYAFEGVNEYIFRCRMQMALYLLQDSAITVKQIAYNLGYQHPQSFSLAFNRYYGFTPVHARNYFTH